MSVISFKKKEPSKETQIFHISKGRYLVMGGPIDMNVGVFWETSVGVPKSVVFKSSRNIDKVMLIWMSKVDQNSTAFKK